MDSCKSKLFIVLHRYKYENNRVMEVSSPDASSPLSYQLYGNGKIGADIPSRGTHNQLLERQVLLCFFFFFFFAYLLSNSSFFFMQTSLKETFRIYTFTSVQKSF